MAIPAQCRHEYLNKTLANIKINIVDYKKNKN